MSSSTVWIKREANLYVGFWGEGKGTLWVDDLELEELALVNVLRRKGCPLVVKSSDGTTIFEEGRDFGPVADPKLGRRAVGRRVRVRPRRP